MKEMCLKGNSFVVVLTLLSLTLGCISTSTSPKINANLLAKIQKHKVNVIIAFEFDKSVLSPPSHFQTRQDKINFIVLGLKVQANVAQEHVINLLQSLDIKFSSYWISNYIIVNDADIDLIQKLAEYDEVIGIYENIPAKLSVNPIPRTNLTLNSTNWNILDIKAPEAWTIGNGTGVLVGSIDTGVRYTHKDLYRNFVGEYGWFDPYDFTELPFDDNGAGTHIIGTIVGANGIGVAPGAKWMTCRGCAGFGCDNGAIMACGQFMLCPSLPDGSAKNCSKAPNIVVNSWTGGQGDHLYDAIFDAWNAAGIVPFFPTGGRGPECFTTSSPGDNERVISTGSTREDGNLSERSSKGPTIEGLLKPEVVAPGDLVLSASYLGDEEYMLLSGTSMANSHTSGVAALIKSVDPTISSLADFKRYITEGAAQNQVPSTGMDCGGIEETIYPNNAVGWGKLDAFATLSKVLNSKTF